MGRMMLMGWFLCAGLGAQAADWSRFRGPNGSGVDETATFAAAWTDGDYAWRTTLPGIGHSSPVGWGDLVVVTSGDAASGELIISGLDLRDGNERWTRRMPGAAYKHHPANSLATSTPALDAERIYVAWMGADGIRAAALTHDGGVVWESPVGAFAEKHGFGTSPIVVDGLVVLAHDGLEGSFILALDAESGATRWKTPRKNAKTAYSTPIVWRGPNSMLQVIAQSTAEGLTGIAVEDGKVLWQEAKAFPDRCVGSPVLWENFAIGSCGSGGNGVCLVCVEPPLASAESPRLVYKLDKKGVPQVPTTLVRGDLLFMWHDRGVVTCCDVKTGEVHWQERVGGNYYGSPICAGGKLYGTSDKGEVVALAAEKEFAELGRSTLGETSHSSPAVQNGRLLFRTQSQIVCLGGE